MVKLHIGELQPEHDLQLIKFKVGNSLNFSYGMIKKWSSLDSYYILHNDRSVNNNNNQTTDQHAEFNKTGYKYYLSFYYNNVTEIFLIKSVNKVIEVW